MGLTQTIDILLVACGVYFMYAWLSMKKTGEINKTILLGNNYDSKKCKDKEGYLACVMPKVLILAIITLTSGIINVVNDKYFNNIYVGSAVTFVFLISIIWYAYTTAQAAKKYF